MTIRQIGIGKDTLHLVAPGRDDEDEIVLRRRFSRPQLMRYFDERADEALDVAFEACSGACRLAHRLMRLVTASGC